MSFSHHSNLSVLSDQNAGNTSTSYMGNHYYIRFFQFPCVVVIIYHSKDRYLI
nr:MAG TPA: hypothetical protein [Caudoviricetes sp.]